MTIGALEARQLRYRVTNRVFLREKKGRRKESVIGKYGMGFFVVGGGRKKRIGGDGKEHYTKTGLDMKIERYLRISGDKSPKASKTTI